MGQPHITVIVSTFSINKVAISKVRANERERSQVLVVLKFTKGQETRGGRTEYLGWGVGFEQNLYVGRCSSSCCSVGKYHGLLVDASFDWKPVDCVEEWGEG